MNTYSIQMDFSDTVGSIKRRIEQRYRIPVSQQNIILSLVLIDDFRVPPNCNISLSTAHVPIMADGPATAPSPPVPLLLDNLDPNVTEAAGPSSVQIDPGMLPPLTGLRPQAEAALSSSQHVPLTTDAAAVPVPSLASDLASLMTEPPGPFPCDELERRYVAEGAISSSVHIDPWMPELGTLSSSADIHLRPQAVTVSSSSHHVPPASTKALLLKVKIPAPFQHDVTIEINKDDTIRNLIEGILLAGMNLPIMDFPLVVRCNGQEMQDSHSLTEYQVSETTEIDVWFKPLRSKKNMVVLVKSHCKTMSIPVEVNKDDKVEVLRKELDRLNNQHELNFPLLPPDNFFFMHERRLLPDDNFFMERVKDGDTIKIYAGAKESRAKYRGKEHQN